MEDTLKGFGASLMRERLLLSFHQPFHMNESQHRDLTLGTAHLVYNAIGRTEDSRTALIQENIGVF